MSGLQLQRLNVELMVLELDRPALKLLQPVQALSFGDSEEEGEKPRPERSWEASLESALVPPERGWHPRGG